MDDSVARWRAFVADDDDDCRVLVARALERAGFDVTESCDGYELIEHVARLPAREQRCSVIVSDIGMPGCDGIEAARRVRGFAPALVVVLVTAFDDASTWQDACACGAALVLRKPVEPVELARLVFDVVHRQRQGG